MIWGDEKQRSEIKEQKSPKSHYKFKILPPEQKSHLRGPIVCLCVAAIIQNARTTKNNAKWNFSKKNLLRDVSHLICFGSGGFYDKLTFSCKERSSRKEIAIGERIKQSQRHNEIDHRTSQIWYFSPSLFAGFFCLLRFMFYETFITVCIVFVAWGTQAKSRARTIDKRGACVCSAFYVHY